jgi:hypothetical protein
MGLLDIYDNTITNPKPLTADYFEARPKVHGLSTWYSYDSTTPMGDLDTCGYTTYKIPIIKQCPADPNTPFKTMCNNQPTLSHPTLSIQLATIKFTYDFDSKVLFYSIDKALSVYGKNLPINALMLKRDGLKEIGQLLEVNMLDIKPGRFYKNIENVKDFELVIDGIKAILIGAGYYLPEF